MTLETPQPVIRPSTDLVGSGWAFPSGVSPKGGVALVGDNDEIVASLRMIIGTAFGERVMRPEFGCGIWDLLFEPINSTTLGKMRGAVLEALSRWEPRIEVEDVIPVVESPNSSMVKIEVRYVITATNSRRNLVYPFYLIPEEE